MKNEKYNSYRLGANPKSNTKDSIDNIGYFKQQVGRPFTGYRKRLGVASFLALALIAGPSLTGTSQTQAAGLGDLFDNSSLPSTQRKFLKVEDAFSVQPVQQGNQLMVELNITPKHYLYKDKLSLKLPEGGNRFPF